MNATLLAKWKSFSLFDFAEGTGNVLTIESTLIDDGGYTALIILTSSIVLCWGLIRLAFHKICPSAVNPVILLLGFLCGRVVHKFDTDHQYDQVQKGTSLLLLRVTVALYGFHCTERMDYHTLNRNLFHIISLSVTYTIISFIVVPTIGYVMMKPAYGWSLQEAYLLCSAILPVEVENTVNELKEARGQVRRLSQILMGERIVTLCIATLTTTSISSALDPNIDDPTGMKHVVRSLAWSIIKAPFVTVVFVAVCKWLSIKAANDHVAQVMLTVPTTICIYCFAVLLGASPTLCVVLFGTFMNMSKPQMLGQKERFINHFWQSLYFITSSILYFCVGVCGGLVEYPDLGMTDLGFILAFFILIFFSRTLSYMLMNPLYMKIGVQPLPWRQAALAIFGGYKGRSTMYLVLAPLFRDENIFRGFIYSVAITLLSWLCGISSITGVLRVLGFYDLDRNAIVNMNMAILQVNNCRTKALFALKMDRFLSDANWGVVDYTTYLFHPYKKTLKTKIVDSDFGEVFQTKTIACSDCGKETLAPLTKKQLEDLRLEAKQRILKAQLVSFMKQHETGTLSLYGFRLLSNLAELGSLKEAPAIDSSEVKIQRGNKFWHCVRSILLLAQKWMTYSYDYVPTNRVRNYCYRLSNSLQFQVVMAILSLVDLTILMSMVGYWFDHTEDSDRRIMDWLQGMNIFFYFVYVIEFFIQLLGWGISPYFKRHVNKLEFGTSTILRTCEVSLFFTRCSDDVTSIMDLSYQDQSIIIWIKFLMIARLTRVYIFFSTLAAVEVQMDEVLMRNYDTGKAYLIGLDRVGKFMTRITENESTYEEMKKTVDQDRLKMTKELSLVQKDYPIIAITVKTRHAVRHVINEMTDCVADMKEEGILDAIETKFLLGSIEELKARHKMMSRVGPCPPDYIFKEVPWLKMEQKVVNHLLKNAILMNYDYSDVIIQQGDDPVGLFVLVSGLVRSVYKPTPTTIQLSAKFGVLPNYDFFVNVKMDQIQEEFVFAGSVIGETGAVTGRRYDMTVVCETAVQVYFVPNECLRPVLFEWEEGKYIQKQIWKSIGIRLAEILFRMDPLFSAWSREALYLYLGKSVIPDLDNVSALYLNNLVDDVILIEGVIMARDTRTVFSGPYQLPRGIQKFILPEHPSWDFQTVYSTRILVIPKANINEDDLYSPDKGIFAEKLTRERAPSSRPTAFVPATSIGLSPSVSPELESSDTSTSPHRTAHSHSRKRVGFMGKQSVTTTDSIAPSVD